MVDHLQVCGPYQNHAVRGTLGSEKRAASAMMKLRTAEDTEEFYRNEQPIAQDSAATGVQPGLAALGVLHFLIRPSVYSTAPQMPTMPPALNYQPTQQPMPTQTMAQGSDQGPDYQAPVDPQQSPGAFVAPATNGAQTTAIPAESGTMPSNDYQQVDSPFDQVTSGSGRSFFDLARNP
jgi:hypothetical protein